MARVSTYLNFNGQTEAAFEFYRRAFGSEYAGAGIMRGVQWMINHQAVPAPGHAAGTAA